MKITKVPQVLRRLYLKVFKPEVHLLLSLAEEAKRLQTVENRVKAVWGGEGAWGRAEHDQLEWLASSHPGNFLKLRGDWNEPSSAVAIKVASIQACAG